MDIIYEPHDADGWSRADLDEVIAAGQRGSFLAQAELAKRGDAIRVQRAHDRGEETIAAAIPFRPMATWTDEAVAAAGGRVASSGVLRDLAAMAVDELAARSVVCPACQAERDASGWADGRCHGHRITWEAPSPDTLKAAATGDVEAQRALLGSPPFLDQGRPLAEALANAEPSLADVLPPFDHEGLEAAVAADDEVSCGNDAHPDGPWHRSTPLPASWDIVERIAQHYRRKAWGCGCRARFASPAQVHGRLVFTTARQGGGSPVIDEAVFHVPDTAGASGRYDGFLIRPPRRDDAGHLWRANHDAGPRLGFGVGWRDERSGPRPWWLSPRSTRRRVGGQVRWTLHNVVAHPLLILCPPLGQRLHDWTAPPPPMTIGGGRPFTPGEDVVDAIPVVEPQGYTPPPPSTALAAALGVDVEDLAGAHVDEPDDDLVALGLRCLAQHDYREDDEHRRPTLGGRVTGTGAWTVDPPNPDPAANPLGEHPYRPALRDPEGGCWVSWLDLKALAGLRTQLESGATLPDGQQAITLREARDRGWHVWTWTPAVPSGFWGVATHVNWTDAAESLVVIARPRRDADLVADHRGAGLATPTARP